MTPEFRQPNPKKIVTECFIEGFGRVPYDAWNYRKISDKDRFNMALSKTSGRLKYQELIKKPSKNT